MFRGFQYVVLLAAATLYAQTARQTISGTVQDPTGASIPDARLRLQSSSDRSPSRTTVTDAAGGFQFQAIPYGKYELDVQRSGFITRKLAISVSSRSAAPIEVALKIADLQQALTVSETADEVSPDAASNLDTVTLDKEMLENLPIFDQNYIGAMSQFLDAGSIATGGVTLIVNGIEQSSLGVSASAIQQVKINQNPYSAEFSRPGRGRIEVITKPATQAFHGEFNFIFRDYHLNARDPFASIRPPEQRRIFEGSLTGPLGRDHKNSFFVTANREEEDVQAIVFAQTPAGLFRQNVDAPIRNTEFSIGANRQINENHLGSLRFTYHNLSENNRGVGGFVLPEAGANFHDREDQLIYNDNLVLSPRSLNQFRFLVARQHTPTTSVLNAPAVVVPGYFTGGGAQADRLQTENHIAFNEILSLTRGKHEIRTGINVPDISRRGLNDLTNSRGTLTYSTLDDYALNRPFSSIRQQGNGHVVFVEVVLGAFIQDEYRVTKSLTLSGGLRYDWQNFFHANKNFSPRTSLAWSPSRSRKWVLRTGGGFFYDRTGPGPIFDLERYDGNRLQQIVTTFPAVTASAQPATLVRLDPTIRIPYTAQFSAGIDRQLGKGTTITATYWATRGVGLFRSRDVNAPPPPFYLVRPNPALGVFRQIESSGHLQNDALEVTFRGRLTKRFNGTIQYALGRAWNDVGGNYSGGTRSTGINSFPANNYDLSGEWARADYDQRHRVNVLGNLKLIKFVNLGVAFQANTGSPYTITTGRDDFHTGYANARPPGVRRNSLEGPASAKVDLRWSHEIVLRKEKKESPKIRFAFDAFNVTNKVNDTGYIGNLSSPFFGRAVSAKPSRRLQLSVKFEF